MDDQRPQFSHSYWQNAKQIPKFSPLNKSTKADVAIVGGGIVGITTALLLAKRNLKIVLIEANEVISRTSGHTTAKVTAQHGLIYHELIQNFGHEKAKLYYESSIEAKQIIELLINMYTIECDYSREHSYLYTNDEKKIQAIQDEYNSYKELEIPSELIEKMPLNIPHKKALVMYDQAQFHPIKYLNELTKQALKYNVEIYEHTRAIDIEYMKQPTIITENNNRITCKYIVQASQYPFYDGEAFFPLRLYAERSYVVAAKLTDTFPGGMYINIESPKRSIRRANNDLLLIAGENHKTGQGEMTSTHYEALESFSRKNLPINDIQ